MRSSTVSRKTVAIHFLFDGAGTNMLDFSVQDNVATQIYAESINVSMGGSQTLYIGVNAFATDQTVNGGRVEYTLTVSW